MFNLLIYYSPCEYETDDDTEITAEDDDDEDDIFDDGVEIDIDEIFDEY